ncbi:MAG: histidine--tRNA ligase [Saprospiraceae bacterium]|jgi:histidyl-tRNA synthetase|nr:histidine--tRNA ligase [Saprospiraceae bacterium]
MKVSLSKGTRDFLPLQARRRKYIFQTIESVFSNFGYQPLETPAMEQLDTLMGKYGDEGDKLLFKIINSGDFLKDADAGLLSAKNSNGVLRQVSEKGLRYDLTVPFARVVSMNQHQISFPFKRYQIQAVWRADRPQRGRYREFYQCDADVVGSGSLVFEAELMEMYDRVFKSLRIPVKIQLNHRAILESFAMHLQRPDLFIPITTALDKLDKTSTDEVAQDLEKVGLTTSEASWILAQIQNKKLDDFHFHENSTKGVKDLQTVFDLLRHSGLNNEVIFEPTLARGLSYYTGCIFEVLPVGIKMGSLGGGGRYDNLTGAFGLPGMSGVGISFGADRIYDVMEEHQLWPEHLAQSVQALIMPLDSSTIEYAFSIAGLLRSNGIPTDLYPEAVKLKKQFAHAESIGARIAIIIGENEKNNQQVSLKNQKTGEQHIIAKSDLVTFMLHQK